MTDVTYWECDPDAEFFRHETIDKAIESYLDDLESTPAEIKVYGYRRVTVGAAEMPDPLEWLLEHLDNENGNPEEGTEPTPAMERARDALIGVVAAEYAPWACERVVTEKVDVLSWVKANCPHWVGVINHLEKRQ